MIPEDHLAALYRADVVDRNGHKIGSVGEIWTDDEGVPAWASVKTGILGHRESLVPLSEATYSADGIKVTYSRDHVESAPRVKVRAGEPLLDSAVAVLYRHYVNAAVDDYFST